MNRNDGTDFSSTPTSHLPSSYHKAPLRTTYVDPIRNIVVFTKFLNCNDYTEGADLASNRVNCRRIKKNRAEQERNGPRGEVEAVTAVTYE